MQFRKAAPGYKKNPLKGCNRNAKCICGSEKKIKKCCGKFEWMEEDLAIDIERTLKSLSNEEKTQIGYRK